MNSKEKIIWKKCNNCGLLQHSSHLRCLKCKHETFKSITASGSAKLLTYTILRAPPAEFRDKLQYALGVLEFENGVRALGQITPHDHLNVGMMMKPVYKKICNNLDGKEVYGYAFEQII